MGVSLKGKRGREEARGLTGRRGCILHRLELQNNSLRGVILFILSGRTLYSQFRVGDFYATFETRLTQKY